MIRKIKKAKKRILESKSKQKKVGFLQKIYNRKKMFYRFIQWFSQLEENFSAKRQDRKSFQSIMIWSLIENPYIVLSGSSEDSHINQSATEGVIRLIRNPRNQKKIGYTVEALTGCEFIEWFKQTYLDPKKEFEYNCRIKDLQHSYLIDHNLDNRVFYIIKHQ